MQLALSHKWYHSSHLFHLLIKVTKVFKLCLLDFGKRDIKSLNWDFLKVNSTMPSYFLDLRKFVISYRICFIIFALLGVGGGSILHSPHIKNLPRIAKLLPPSTIFDHVIIKYDSFPIKGSYLEL